MNTRPGRDRPQVRLTTDSVAQAHAYQQLHDDLDWTRQKREERARMRAIRRAGVATDFCSQCGRPWRGHYVSRKALAFWVAVIGIAAWWIGARMVVLGIVHFG